MAEGGNRRMSAGVLLPLVLSLSKDERDEDFVLSEPLILRQAQDER